MQNYFTMFRFRNVDWRLFLVRALLLTIQNRLSIVIIVNVISVCLFLTKKLHLIITNRLY